MGMFLGNDITKPVEYFIHVVEYQAQMEGWDDETMIERLMDRIPDSKIIINVRHQLRGKKQLFLDLGVCHYSPGKISRQTS